MNFSEQIEYQKKTCLITLGHLFDKYQDEEYMLSKLNNYILIQLPKLMDNHKISQQEKQAKIASFLCQPCDKNEKAEDKKESTITENKG